jgi:lysophospholipase L1-like esterase
MYLYVLLACSLCFLTARCLGAEVVNERGGLNNTFQKLAKGEKTLIAYFGGSITAGAGASKPSLCYRALLTQHLRQQFPKTEIAEWNAAIGGTGSWLGAFRLRNDVLDRKPDLLVVEFAVNDGGDPENQVYASMEGIVRQTWAANPMTDILFLYTLAKGHMDAFKKGELPDRMQWHEKIAEYYGIPSVNMAQFAASKVLANELTFDEFAKDGVHPTDKGYALYLESLKPFIAQCKAAAHVAQPPSAVPHKLPNPFSKCPMDKAKLISYERAKADDKWKAGQASPVDRFLHVFACDLPGATVTLRFKGDCIGYYDAIGPDTGDLEFSIDGGPWQPKPNFDQWCKGGYRPHCRVLATGLDPNAEHELKLRVAEAQPKDSKGRFARIGFFLVNGDAIAEDPYKGMTPLQRIDAIYAAMEPVKYVAPPDRWKYLPSTMKRLREGPALRIVMLGDSIVNDTGSSQYDLLLMRMYPKCKVERLMSVRGSTGCWWYKDENRVKEWVIDKNPDLLMIGGISQKDDVESIREVIKQVSAGMNPPPEILLMTPVFGSSGDPRKNKKWTYSVDPKGDDYRARLLRMAAEEKCEFLDMTGPWGRYILDSQYCCGWFMRDVVHANERGFQILGRILEKYFSPR